MLNEQTLGTLNALKLFGMAKSFNDKLAHPKPPIFSHPEFFALIVQIKNLPRKSPLKNRLLSNAKLKQQAALRRHRSQTSPWPKQTGNLSGTILPRLDRPPP